MPTVPEHFFVQSAVIPYRVRADSAEILVITSRKAKRWVIPKGVKEPGLSAQASAAREALEEAGIEGVVSAQPVGHYEYSKWGGTCRVAVFAMAVETVHEHWQESYRRREWVGVDEAEARVDEEALKRLIRSIPVLLQDDRIA